MTSRDRLIERINHNGNINDLNTPRPLVTLEEFFEDNDDYGSIGYNFYPYQPPPREFYEFFKRIRSREEVKDVLVEISQHDNTDEWPCTDTIWIITSASPDEVRSWLGVLFRADDMLDGWDDQTGRESYEVPLGMRPIGIWWD